MYLLLVLIAFAIVTYFFIKIYPNFSVSKSPEGFEYKHDLTIGLKSGKEYTVIRYSHSKEHTAESIFYRVAEKKKEQYYITTPDGLIVFHKFDVAQLTLKTDRL